MTIEAIKLQAYTLFLKSDNWDEIAQAVDKPVGTIKKWARNEGWYDRKDNFYRRTQDKIDEKLDDASTRIAQDVLDFSSEMIEAMREKLTMELRDVDAGNFKDFMLGIKTGVEAIKELLNVRPEKKEGESDQFQLIASGMSIEKQKILLGTLDKMKVQLPELEEEDVIEVEGYHKEDLIDKEESTGEALVPRLNQIINNLEEE